MIIIDKIREKAAAYFKDIVDIRRHLHMHPELSFQEYKTSEFIQSKLTEWGIPFTAGVANTGIVALIKGQEPESATIALRADIDALPIREEGDKPYKSINDGVMHACGHDVHTSSLLGVARILNELTDEFEGTVKLIFQPAEERFPGGASLMIKEGVLKNPEPASIFGQHVHVPLEAGKVGFRSGKYMASADEIYIDIIGKGGHAAMPHDLIDPVITAAELILNLQSLVSRNASPFNPTVLSFGRIESAGSTNVIPDRVRLEGTFRAMDEDWRSEAHKIIERICKSTADTNGAIVELEIRKGYPFLVNDEDLTERARDWAAEYVGDENVVELELRMGAEDFAYYSQEMPGCFYRLGIRNESNGITSGLHTPTFDVDETALETGMGLMAFLAIKELDHLG